MSDNSTAPDLHLARELPQRVAGEHLHPLLLVVPPPQFGRKAAEPTVHPLVVLSRALTGLCRLNRP